MQKRKTPGFTKEIIINSALRETRLAILENNKLADLFVELPENERMVGDIYLGRVVNVVRGMRAAFIDIGQEQDAFLHFSDIGQSLIEYGDYINLESTGADIPKNNRRPVPRQGQDLLVQIIKEPISNKGCRITTELSIPGRFFVLVPNSNVLGVSKKIGQLKERRRLKHLVREMRPKGFGVIIRTDAENKDDSVLRADFEGLLKKWQQIAKKLKTVQPPTLVFKDLGMASSVIRDLFTEDVSRVVVDDSKQFKEIQRYLKDVAPELVSRVERYSGNRPIFDAFGIEEEIEKSLSRKVWMKSGGYIIFDHTEALVAIDVNSGKFMGRRGHDENSLRINLEAAKEIARQLRLRDIGGIIVIDFIDMTDTSYRRILYNEFKKELRRDRAQSNISPISEFGLIEMTRERIRPSLMHTYSDVCPTCNGIGRVSSKPSIITKVERAIRRVRAATDEKSFVLEVNPEIGQILSRGLRSHIRRMMWKYWVVIEVVEKETLKPEEFKFYSKKSGEEIVLSSTTP